MKSVDKIQGENKKLKNELDKLRKIEKKSESSQDIHKQGQQEERGSKRTSVVQTSYESGIKELSQEFRVRLQEELTQREEVEKQLEKQNSLKTQMEMSIQNLEEDVSEKQATIGSLKGQLEDIKCINLEMYTKLADIQEHCPHCSRELCQLKYPRNELKFQNIKKVVNKSSLKHSKSGIDIAKEEENTPKSDQSPILNKSIIKSP